MCEHCQENAGPHCHSWQALIIHLWESRRGRKKKSEILLQWQVKGKRILGFFVVADPGGISSILPPEVNHQELLCGNTHSDWVACIFQDGAFPWLQSVFRPYLLTWFRIWGLHSVYGLIGDFLFINLLIPSDTETMNSWVRWLLFIMEVTLLSLIIVKILNIILSFM